MTEAPTSTGSPLSNGTPSTNDADAEVSRHSKGIVSTSGLLLIRKIVVTFGSAIATAVIARKLAPGSFGVYSAAMATFFLAQSLCDLGFGTIVAREMAIRTTEQAKLLRATMRPATIWSAVLSLGLAGFALLSDNHTRTLCLLILAPAITLTGAAVARQYFVVAYNVRRMATVDTACNLSQAIGLVVVSLLGGDAPELALVVSVFAVLDTVLIARLARLDAGKGDSTWSDSWQITRMSLPFGLASLLASAYFTIDLVIAGYMVSDTEVARYAAGVKLLTLVTVLPSLLMSTALPGLSAVDSAGDRRALGDLAARVWHWLASLALPPCIAIACFAPLAIEVFFGHNYDRSAAPTRILMAAGAVALMTNVLGMLLIAQRRAAVTFWQNAVALVGNVGLNLLLIPHLGIMICAWLTLGTEIFICAASFPLVRKTLVWTPILRVSAKPFVSLVGFAVVAALPIPTVLRLVLATAAFLGAMTLTRGWPDEVQTVLSRRLHRG
ncbi:MAG: hypothetical protein JWN95_3568 [Frankiales bacterium]|nr:hypothetical protein [Frankiales bacterium]